MTFQNISTKQIWCFLAIILCLSTNLFAQNDSQATITFYRLANANGGALATYVEVTQSTSVKLFNHSYYTLNIAPGKVAIQVKKNAKTKMTLDVKPGQNYHVLYQMNQGFFAVTEDLMVLDSATAQRIKSLKSMDKLTSPHTLLLRPQHRFGLAVNLAGGSDSWDVFTLTDGRIATFSYGSGGGFEFWYGQELHKYFDINFKFNYHQSTLSPPVKDVEMTFTRKSFSLTPSFIIPIKEGDFMRLKIGLGIDYYFPSEYTFDFIDPLSKYHFKNTWVYKENIGAHVALIYELNLSKSFSFIYGLRFNQVNYQFQSGGVNSIPNSNKTISPNGSGINFQIGCNYHF